MVDSNMTGYYRKIKSVGILIGVLVCSVFQLPNTSEADTPGFTGTFTLDEERSDDFTEAFEGELQEMGRFRRAIARRLITRRGGHAEKIHIEVGDEYIILQSDERDPIRFPANGDEFTHTNEDGDEMTASAQLDGNILKISMMGDDGGSVTEYRLDSEGKAIRVNRKLESDQLNNPVRFSVVYNRD